LRSDKAKINQYLGRSSESLEVPLEGTKLNDFESEHENPFLVVNNEYLWALGHDTFYS
jgi:hypothetical protein